MKVRLIHNAAFSLVEVTLALGVAGVSLIAIFGLLPVGLQSSRASIEQTVANGILSAVAADLRATPPTAPPGGAATSQHYAIPIPPNPIAAAPAPLTLYFSEDGKSSTSLAATSRSRLTIEFQPNGPKERTATFASLKLTWPAAASLANAAGSVQTFIALDRN